MDNESQDTSAVEDNGLTMTVSATESTLNGQDPEDDDEDIGEYVDEDEGDDGEESEEEEDIEPMVIYERMKNEITTICSQRDAISCFAVHYKVQIISTVK